MSRIYKLNLATPRTLSERFSSNPVLKFEWFEPEAGRFHALATYKQNKGQATRGTLPKSVIEWLANGTVKGQRNPTLFYCACQFRDAGYSFDESYPRLLERSLADGLGEKEISKTVKEAWERPPREPIHAPGSAPGPTTTPAAATSSAAPKTVHHANGKLPDPIADGFKQFLNAVFLPGEYIAISDADAYGNPHSGITLTREKWVEYAGNGKLAIMIPDNPNGVFIRINPVKRNGKSDADVTVFRHVLAEFDLDDCGNFIPLETQFAALVDSRLPLSTLSFSGGKSLHGLVKVDAKTRAEYDERCEKIWKTLEAYCLDTDNKNPSRYSRAPGFKRGAVDQTLIGLGLGAASWAEWENPPKSAFPEIKLGTEIVKVILPLPPDVIEGVVALGEKGQLCGGSKSFKTWSLVDQGLSISAGAPWWGLPTKESQVIYLNLEIPEPFFDARIRDIARIRGLEITDNFKVWNLRGCNLADPAKWQEFINRLGDYCTRIDHPYLITDPIYKLLAGRNENAAGDIGALLWQMEEMIQASGGTNFFGHHFAKGDSTSKAAIDRGAGSGVFQRDPDTVLVMTGNGSALYSVEFIVRNHVPVSPFVIEWKPPLFIRNDAIDPAGVIKRSGARGPKARFEFDTLVQWLGNDVLTTAQFKTRVMNETGMSRTLFYQLLKEAQAKKAIYFDKTSSTWEVPMKPL